MSIKSIVKIVLFFSGNEKVFSVCMIDNKIVFKLPEFQKVYLNRKHHSHFFFRFNLRLSFLYFEIFSIPVLQDINIFNVSTLAFLFCLWIMNANNNYILDHGCEE